MSLTAEQRRMIEEAFADLHIEPEGALLNPVLESYAARRGWTIDEVNDAVAAALEDHFIEPVPGPPPGYQLSRQ